MPKPKVLLTRKIPASVVATLEAACDVDYNDGTPFSPDELKSRLMDKDGIVSVFTDAITADVMDAAKRLKVIANIAVGFNSIDVAAARARDIVVTNTPDVLTESTADLTWALIMDITRRGSEGDRLVRRGGWKAWSLEFMLGMELRGKQLGIIGYGRIGRAVAARAIAFGLRVVYSNA